MAEWTWILNRSNIFHSVYHSVQSLMTVCHHSARSQRGSCMWRLGGGVICSRHTRLLSASGDTQPDLQPRGWCCLTGSSDTVSPSDYTADIKAIYFAAIQHIQYISIQNWFNKMTEECVRPYRRPTPQNGHILILLVLSMALWRRCFASIWLLWSD